MDKKERDKRIKAALGTTGVCTAVLLILILTAAWRTAGSGDGEYPGIEVNLGYDEQGSGDVQPQTPIGEPDATDDEDPASEPQPAAEHVASTEVPIDQPETPIVQPTTVTDPNSDVEIKEETKEVKPVEKPVEKKPETPVEKAPVEKPVEKPREVDTKAVYKGKSNSTTTSGTENGTGKQGSPGSEGDDEGVTGDKGVEGGTEGAAVYKGRPGGGDGGGLEINGWDYDKIPSVTAPDDQTGRVVFAIELDEEGLVTKIQKISGTVSPATERECHAAIQKITFTKKTGVKVPEVTKGRITFVVRAR